MKKITIDPVTRIEGHLRIEADVEDGVVKQARSSGTLFRGFEVFLRDREARDAARMTQRVCGVCPAAHATASALALDEVYGVADRIPMNGRILRNLILGANFLQSHIMHFYTLSALDYVDVTVVENAGPDEPELRRVLTFMERDSLSPFVPRYEGDFRLSGEANRAAVAHYVQALQIRRTCHEMLAVFGGRMPHQMTTCVGGVFSTPTEDKMMEFVTKLDTIRDFIRNAYLPDVLAVADAYPDYLALGQGISNYLAYGVFELGSAAPPLSERDRLFSSGFLQNGELQSVDLDRITEHVTHSWFEEDSGGAPATSSTRPAPRKPGGYSWIKAPRYGGEPCEVGPIARALIAYHRGESRVKTRIDTVLAETGLTLSDLQGVLGRHVARALEAGIVADAMREWVMKLCPGGEACAEVGVPTREQGVGLTEGPRGALGHWMRVDDGRIRNYQLVVPTTWNASPRDNDAVSGPIEQALVGTRVRDTSNPAELVRIVRSFDPCLACAVHVLHLRQGERHVVYAA
jgi:hydrogenase large subunit